MKRSEQNDNNKVIKYRKPIRINIGVIIFFIIFIYMVVNVGIYLSRDHIAIYEVVKRSIADDNCITGLALRDETVYYTDTAGYVNYFYQEGSKVAKNSRVYTVDESGSIYSILSSQESEAALSSSDIHRVRSSISRYVSSYHDNNYDEVSSLKYNLENDILEITNASMLDRLQAVLSDTSDIGAFITVNSDCSGIIGYTVDGMESLTVSSLTKKDFDIAAYAEKMKNTRSTEVTTVGSPVYKMVNSEDWQIVIPINDDQLQQLQNMTTVSLTFVQDQVDVKAAVEITMIEGEYYAILSLNRFMVRYVNDRYIEVELHLNSATGLKIPVSSLTTKDFFVVPAQFYVTEEETEKTGIMAEVYDEETKQLSTEFIEADVFFMSEDEFYIDTAILEGGTYLVSADNMEKCQLGERATLQGVYNVNKGYYIFRRVEIVYRNEEYCIVSEDTAYGLSAYDHIVADASVAVENSIIY